MGQTQTAELLSLADQLEESLQGKLQDASKHVELCRKIVLAMRGAAPNIKKVSGTRIYLGKYDIDEVLRYITKLGGSQDKSYLHEDNLYFVKMHSARYKMFLDNISCIRCGIIGEFFQMERMTDGVSDRAHFNLYGIHPTTGAPVMMTKDHILPRSKGGKDNLSNYQTMCSICNGEKGNALENDHEIHIQKYTDWISPNERWILTIDKVSGFPSIPTYYMGEPRYTGRAINLSSGKEYPWSKSLSGKVTGCSGVPKYVKTRIKRMKLTHF